MLLEVATLNILPGESADFERAFAEAQAISAAMPGDGYGVQRMVETDKRTCAEDGG
jgi:heme-degrading monooxygenase HmoA